MTNELTELLDHIGYDERPQQTRLFEHLITLDNTGVIAQAGTGVGKSIAVLAAAVHLYRKYEKQVLIVTPLISLMDQYMRSDVPSTAKCFGISIEELRGKRHYPCELDEDGCPGHDGGCTAEEWVAGNHWCNYREQKERAMAASIVVTNADMLIVNDRLLPDPFFDREGPLLVDEGHTLEPKLRDFSDRKLRADWLERENAAGKELAKFIFRFKRDPETVTGSAELPTLLTNFLRSIEAQVSQGITPGKRAQEMYESANKIYSRVITPHENALVWANGEALNLSWVDVSASARELLQARPFALVSATVPNSMPSSLGVGDAKVVDVGHPFDYARQATLSISQVNGAYQYSREKSNLQKRAAELKEHILKHGGGALCLFSSFKDMENVYEELIRDLRGAGLTVLKQGGSMDNKELGERFKQDGNAVLFGSESFATGFDVPGKALRFVSIWKLPYPGKDPVTEALMKRFYLRYNDLMLTRVTQAIGRLIRTTDDEGHVWIGDCRAEGKILGDNGLMTRHLKEFTRA